MDSENPAVKLVADLRTDAEAMHDKGFKGAATGMEIAADRLEALLPPAA